MDKTYYIGVVLWIIGLIITFLGSGIMLPTGLAITYFGLGMQISSLIEDIFG